MQNIGKVYTKKADSFVQQEVRDANEYPKTQAWLFDKYV